MLVAVLMLMSSFAALANEPDTTTPPSGALNIDTSVTVTNLDAGDSVKFVKMVKWVDGTGWAWDDDFASKLATVVTEADERTALFDRVTGQNKGKSNYVAGKISAPDGATLAKAAAQLTGTSVDAVANTPAEDYKATLELANAATANDAAKMGFVGLYCALVTPAKADTMYNPVFIGADFGKQGSTPDTINSQSATTALSYDPVALAKKETISLTKEITGENNGTAYPTGNTKYDLDVGDDVQFTITSWIPA